MSRSPLLYSPATLGTLPQPQLLTSVHLSNCTMSGVTDTLSGQQPPSLPTTVHPMVLPTPPTGMLPTSSEGLILSPAAAPFPGKLVNKVRSGQFVKMRELLTDNISLVQQLEAMQSTSPISIIGPSRPRLREVSTLSTWLYCFLAYTAITSEHMQEALRHGNSGWLDYDRAFRQQAAKDTSIRWNNLLPGMQASMILGNPARQGVSNTQKQACTLCRG